ncbi:pectinesterase [Saonia flava]|uniref:Pectinesterase n=1 Tax=Saonia flava TaxID=523696 RepID=A0A846QYV1_9FLAO|nr:alpha/beta hydrolase [Saonia flava]NJB71822.1 pectinesterase [Saonia flava]
MVKKYVCPLSFVTALSCSLHVIGQSYEGVTREPDSSYTTKIAFEKTLKTYPNIEIVEEFNFETVVEEKNIAYNIVDGRVLKLDVFRPKVMPQLGTAIIIVHGGGWRSGNRTQHYPLAQSLANLGYVCFTPEYRLSTEALFPAAVFDIKAAIRWVRDNASEYNISLDKISLVGFSAGGELAAFVGVTGEMDIFNEKNSRKLQSSKINAVVNIDGILSFTHPDSVEGDDTKNTSAATYWFGYAKKDNLKLWDLASPLTHVGPNSPPILFLNSKVSRMHAGRDDYIQILDRHTIVSEVYEFKGAPHSFCLFHPWFMPTVEYVDKFLKRILG